MLAASSSLCNSIDSRETAARRAPALKEREESRLLEHRRTRNQFRTGCRGRPSDRAQTSFAQLYNSNKIRPTTTTTRIISAADDQLPRLLMFAVAPPTITRVLARSISKFGPFRLAPTHRLSATASQCSTLQLIVVARFLLERSAGHNYHATGNFRGSD